MNRHLVVWHLTDGKPGHVNQALGLLRALERRVDLRALPIPVRRSRLGALSYWLWPGFAPGRGLPRPDLILAAGHKTHLAAVKARRVFGGKIVVLMGPQVPRYWFDLCFIPEHDDVSPGEHVVATRGVLNTISPSSELDDHTGLMLIGGPSKHHGWSNEQALAQLGEVLRADPAVQWTLTTSRRTPEAFESALHGLNAPNLRVVPYHQTGPEWVAQRLKRSGRVWVTEDSVSMVYEALTAGAAVGILSVPRERGTRRGRAGMARVIAGLQKLIDGGWATPFDAWRQTGALHRPPGRLGEADRCAEIVLQRLFPELKPGDHPKALNLTAHGEPLSTPPHASSNTGELTARSA